MYPIGRRAPRLGTPQEHSQVWDTMGNNNPTETLPRIVRGPERRRRVHREV